MRRLLILALLLPVLPLVAQDRPLDRLAKLLAETDDTTTQRDVLLGMTDSLQGRRSVVAPKGWAAVYAKLSKSKDAEVRRRVIALSVLFGDPSAMKSLMAMAGDPKSEAANRLEALEALLDKRADGTPALLRQLLDDEPMRRAALRGLARFEGDDVPGLLLSRYPKFSAAEKGDAVTTLVSRPAYALALLAAIEKKAIPPADLSSFQARQILALKDKRASDKLNAVWGNVRAADKGKEQLLAKYVKMATPEALKNAKRERGRAVWVERCGQCHILFGEGGKIGPDLTGSQRGKPEYVLHKVLDPNAVVPRDYQVTRVTTTRGRVLLGLVKEENEKVLVLQLQNEEVRVAKADIEERERTSLSMMPEGLLKGLDEASVRDLLAYLAGDGQVPLPKNEKQPSPRK
jgi:putative heme-binding domain-containing protein